jgi:hypothetical protein
MFTEVVLPADLIQSAHSLEERLQLLHVPTRKIQLTEWNSLSSKIQNLVPNWIPTLLAKYSLIGGVLECGNCYEDQNWARNFCFWGPAEYERNLSSEDYNLGEEILATGLVPISDEKNGDMWVTSISGGPSSPIYLFDLSGMKKILASSRLALLMASMAISEVSFRSFGKSLEPTSVMWHSEI